MEPLCLGTSLNLLYAGPSFAGSDSYLFIYFCVLLETESHCVAKAVLELSV
jgi:hypothetical protein